MMPPYILTLASGPESGPKSIRLEAEAMTFKPGCFCQRYWSWWTRIIIPGRGGRTQDSGSTTMILHSKDWVQRLD